MLIQFRTNLGSVDASRFDLDFKQCTEGSTVTASGVAGRWLVDRGIATDITPPPEPKLEPITQPVSVEAVADEDAELEAATAPEPQKKNKK